ncbi:hypothetical protein A8C56_14540 [Niabella ginsenosidivorans]|uniref:Uncharacterized protein n=1 Tax=Niabella ginsenosidivorans TaxID=1176587 RepID=A0A1A9I3Y2_9BACT|nr:hypothetical protein A8C56_14540 [Niabella ginsenosidivorans]
MRAYVKLFIQIKQPARLIVYTGRITGTTDSHSCLPGHNRQVHAPINRDHWFKQFRYIRNRALYGYPDSNRQIALYKNPFYIRFC